MSVRSSPKRTIQLGDDDARFMAGADAAGGQRAYIVGLMDAGQWRTERPPECEVLHGRVLNRTGAVRATGVRDMGPDDIDMWDDRDRWAPLPTEPVGE